MTRYDGSTPTRPESTHSGAFCLAAALLLLAATAVPAAEVTLVQPKPPQASWSVGLRSTGYAYQYEDEAGNTDDRFENYNVISGSASGLAGGWLTFQGAGRFANDQTYARPGFETSRFYNGYFEARITPLLKARVGRMFLQSGVASLTLDGAWLSYRRGRALEVSAWGGSRAPNGLAFDFDSIDQSGAAGARVAWKPGRTWRLAASGAYRERWGRVAGRPLGAEIATTAVRNTRIFGRVAYDLETEQWAKIQLQARWSPRTQVPEVVFQYIDRTPSIDAASWFSRFTDLKRIRLARAAIRYQAPSRFGGEIEYLGSFIDTRTTSRLGLALLAPYTRLGYSFRMGDAGEENRFYGEVGGNVLHWLWLDAHATVMTYALMQDAPADQERDLTTLAARARVDLRQGFRVIAEVQSLNDPVFSKDVRFLLGIDLSMARGTSRYGLDRGRWF